jgi:hypothetical protein
VPELSDPDSSLGDLLDDAATPARASAAVEVRDA